MAIAPNHISKELFENALKTYFKNENIEILEYTCKTALPVGENYASEIFKSTITYSIKKGEKKEMCVIIKCFPQNEMMRDLIEKWLIFEGEANIYMNVLPAINNVLGPSKQISGKCIYFTKDPSSIIILEDLSVIGFKMHPRQQGLNLEHCLIVVEKLSFLHAASLALYEKDPSPINIFTEGLFGVNHLIEKWVKTGFNSLIEVTSHWPGFEKYSEKLQAISEQALERTYKSRKLGNFNVLNHGDSWNNNFMFSYQPDGKVKDLRLVDFQIVLYGSPTIDLNYFFVTSPTIDVRKHHFHELIDHYYTNFIKTLEELNHPLTSVPSKEQLLEDFNCRAFYGLASSVTILPIVTASSRNDATIEALLVEEGDENTFQHDAFNNERYREHMEFLLPFFDKLGMLD